MSVLIPASDAALMRNSGLFDLLYSDTVNSDEITDYLEAHRVEIGFTSYVQTERSPFNWPVKDDQNRYYSGVYTFAGDIEQVIGHQFSGDLLRNEMPLIIVASVYEKGFFFTALCRLLEYALGRRFDYGPSAPPTVAFFNEVRNPETHQVTIRNAIVPVIHDMKKVPWFGYVPLANGQYTHDQNPIRVFSDAINL